MLCLLSVLSVNPPSDVSHPWTVLKSKNRFGGLNLRRFFSVQSVAPLISLTLLATSAACRNPTSYLVIIHLAALPLAVLGHP